jgi:type VI protein secretion system component Hcp
MKLDGSKDEVATRLESLEEENRQLEAISFTFRKIEWTSVEGKTTALDDWAK